MDETTPWAMRHDELGGEVNRVTGQVVDAAIAVQRELGPGLLERVYQVALPYELQQRGLHVEVKVPLDARYRELVLASAYEMDLVVENAVVVEMKAAETLHPRHFRQLLTYLRFSGHRVGLLINFHAWPLKHGIHRIAR